MWTTISILQTILLLSLPPDEARFNIFLPAPALPATLSPLPAEPYPAVGKFMEHPPHFETDPQVRTVVIDAGHGGHDPGCLGSGSREKHLALGIAREVAASLRAKHPDLTIIMTRDEDVFIPLYQRAAIANRNQADLFISIHCNFMPGSAATRGTETYVMGLHTAEHNLDVAKRENAAILLEADYEKNYDYDPHSPEGHIMLSMYQNAFLEQSILFADQVENHFAKTASRRSRGVKQAGFVVLKETTMPSVLIETGFLSNAREEAYLMTAAGQAEIAKAITEAFSDYKMIVESPEYLQVSRPVADLAALPSAPNEVPSTTNRPARAQTVATTSPPARQPVETTPPTPAAATPSSKPATVFSNVYKGPRVPVKENITIDNAPGGSTYLQFFVQLAASPNPQATTDTKWRSLPYVVEVIREDNLYKYRARNFKSLEEAQEAKAFLRENGFADAFIVVYKGEERISMSQARKEMGLN